MCQTASKLFLKCELQDVFIVIAVKDYAICISVDDNLTLTSLYDSKKKLLLSRMVIVFYFTLKQIFFFTSLLCLSVSVTCDFL